MGKIINFDESLKEEVLDIFDKKVSEDELIVERETNQKVLSPDGEEVSLTEFVGIANGSELFIKSDLISLIKFSKRQR